MAEIKIKEGSAIIEFWDDSNAVFVAHFPEAKFGGDSDLQAVRCWKDASNKKWKEKAKVTVPKEKPK